MSATEFRIGSLGDIPIITGVGSPSYLSPSGTVYRDRNTGYIYRNVSGTTWSQIATSYAFLIYDFSGSTSSGSTISKYTTNIGDNITTVFTITHNLGSEDVIAEVYDNSSKETVYCDILRINSNSIQVSFANPPSTNAYRVIIIT